MSLGIIMLVHTGFDRVEQVARHWAAAGCPVVIHVDAKVADQDCTNFINSLSDLPNIRFADRNRCHWGTWGLVHASQTAAQLMLDEFPEASHLFLTSGSCIPLRPVQELKKHLAERPETDFIESAALKDVSWAIGGLDKERFTKYFPFSWKRQRYLFDKFLEFQRLFGFRRRIPSGLVPHMGSQWWCLTRKTMSAILSDPMRNKYDRYFQKVWIPDESYFQTLVRKHSSKIVNRSLTLSKFDNQGRPYVFFNDHIRLLRISGCFVARKIWSGADMLYQEFLSPVAAVNPQITPNPSVIDRLITKASSRRTFGRPGLYMQSRFPNDALQHTPTCEPYSVFEGFDYLFENFGDWLSNVTSARVHGHLFAPERADFADGQKIINGGLSDSATLRDYNPQAFLSNLIWNTRGERQIFMFSPRDNPQIEWVIAKDPNAQISVITGAWAIPLFKQNKSAADARTEASLLQKSEERHLGVLRSRWGRARIRIWTLAEFLESYIESLHTIVVETGEQTASKLIDFPQLTELTGFADFLQDLRNQGLHPNLIGDFPDDLDLPRLQKRVQKSFLAH